MEKKLPSLSSRVEKKSGEKNTVEEKHAYKDWLNERQAGMITSEIDEVEMELTYFSSADIKKLSQKLLT